MKNRFWAILAVPLCLAGCVNPAMNNARSTRALPAYTAPIPPQKPVTPQKDPDAYRESDSGRSYSLTLKNADLRDVLLLLSKESGVSIVAERGLQGTVQVDAKNKKLGEILYTILKPLGYTASVENGMILVGRPKLSSRTFRVNYIKDKRNSTSNMNVSGFSGSGSSNSGSGSSSSGSGSSSVTVSTEGKSDFWGALENSLEMLVFGTSGMGRRDGGGYIRGEAEKKLVAESKTSGSVQTNRNLNIQGGNNRNIQRSVNNKTAYDETNLSSLQTTEADDPMLLNTQINENQLKQLVVNELAGIIQVTDYAENLDRIASFLTDVEEGSKRQVLIQTHIMEVTLKDSFSLGIDWKVILDKGSNLVIGQSLAPNPLTSVFTLASPLSQGKIPNLFQPNIGGTTGSSFNNQFSLMLDAMKEQGNVNMLSSPKITALNNQKAVIKLTTKQVSWVSTKTTGTGTNPTDTYTTVPQIDEVGIFLDVTPQIGQDNSITMQIHPSVSEITMTSTSPDGTSTKPVINIREIDTMVDAKAGETIVIAGLISDKLNESKRSVPFLGDIPYLGALFSYNIQERTKAELVIVMTPYILNARSIEEIRKEHELRLQNIGGNFHLINNMGSMVTEEKGRVWIEKSQPHLPKHPAIQEGNLKTDSPPPDPPPTATGQQPEAPSAKPAVPKIVPPPLPEVNKPTEPAVKGIQSPPPSPAIKEKTAPVAVTPTETKTASIPKAAAPVKKASTTPTLEGITSSKTGIRLDISSMKERPAVLRETGNRRIIIKMPGVTSAVGDADLQLKSLGFKRAKVARHTEGIWVVLHSNEAEMQRIVPRFDDNGLTIVAAPPLSATHPVEQARMVKKPLPLPETPIPPPAAAAVVVNREKTEQPVSAKPATTQAPTPDSSPSKEKSAPPPQVAISTTATNEQTLYRAGVTAYKVGNCTEAVKFLNSFLNSYPQSPFAGDAVVYRSDCQERGRITADSK